MHNQNNTNLKKHGGLYKYLKPPLDIKQKIVWPEILILSRTSAKIKEIRATDLVFVLIKAFKIVFTTGISLQDATLWANMLGFWNENE